MSQQPPNTKIIRVPTAQDPDGEFGVCWRTVGVAVLLGTPTGPGLTGIPASPQPIPIATAAPCLGPRCTAWHEEMKQCSFIGLNLLQIERATEPSATEILTPYMDKLVAFIEGKGPKPNFGPGLFDKPGDDPNRN